MDEARRYNVVNCGRRFGKTELGKERTIDTIERRQPVGWFAPTYKMMIEVWSSLRRELSDMISRASLQEARMEFTNGATLDMWSLDNPDAGRGRKYARVIVDEAAMVRNLMEAWTAGIRPTLTDLKGDAWFLSTPKGHNGFWQLYQLGLDGHEPHWQCWQMPTITNPYIDPAEVEAAKRMLPERVYMQEYEAVFLADAGGVFRRVMDAATATEQTQAEPAHQYIFGVDWGKSNDFTVISVLDINRQALIYIDRFNQIDYQVQLGRLQVLYERFQPTAIIAESNSMGQPLIEQLYRQDMPVQPFQTTNATKAQIIDGLSLAFERGDIQILNDPVLIHELQAYEMERLPSGLLRYSAPEGMHDDCVMSLALAWYGGFNTGAEVG